MNAEQLDKIWYRKSHFKAVEYNNFRNVSLGKAKQENIEFNYFLLISLQLCVKTVTSS